MDQCKIEHAGDIIRSIQAFLYRSDKKDLKTLESYVKIRVPLAGDFSLAQTVSTDKIFKKDVEKVLQQYGMVLSDFVKDMTSSIVKTKSNAAIHFTSTEIIDMFHTLPMVKSAFESKITSDIIRETVIGSKDSKTYVSTNDEVTRNLSNLKEKLFSQIQDFLIKKKVITGPIQKLFTQKGDVENYTYYTSIMKKLDVYFFESENFSLIKTYSGQSIPNLAIETKEDEETLDAYNSGIFLNNFDSVISAYFSGVIDVNYTMFNDLQATSKVPKYSVKIEGLKTDYWLADTHAAEGSESSESKLVKLIISTIPVYNKKNKNTGKFMEMADFYLFAAQIADFEVKNGNQLKSAKDSTYKYFNENPEKGLKWYVEQIAKGDNNIPGLKEHFQMNSEFAISLKNYFDSKELNIKEKDANSDIKLTNILAQVVNNNFGASYLKYNANGNYRIQEMYKQNFNNLEVQSMLFAKMLSNSAKQSFYKKEDVESDLAKILNNITIAPGESLKTMPINKKIALGAYIGSKTGIYLSYLSVDELIDDLTEANNGNLVTKERFSSLFSSFMTSLRTDFESVRKGIDDGTISAAARGDVETSDYLKESVKDSFFKGINNAYLVNEIIKPVMNIETLNGAKLPTFKLATLTHKDTELFEVQREFENKNQGLFHSLLIKDAVILGTGTKLEVVNGSDSKEAVKFNVAENFQSDIQFDFLENLISSEPKFNILLGNYSDKNTVLTKVINGKFSLDGKTPIAKTDIGTILETVRMQSAAYYKDLITKVLDDYSKLFDFELDKDIDKNIDKINKILSDKNSVRDLSKKASDLGINFTEELHYSKYSDGKKLNKIRLNQLIVDNYHIFNNITLFNKFGKNQEASMINKLRKYVSNNSLVFVGKNQEAKMKQYLEALNLTDADFYSEDGGKVDYGNLNGQNGINPILRKWMWLNAMFRNEYLYISAKGEYMHPHKNKLLTTRSGKFDEKYWDEYSKEMSGRLSSMAKRNVLFTATIEVPVRKSKLGVPENVNMATIEDHTDQLYNINGQEHKQDAHDGSSLINYLYSKMIDNSYPSKGYSGTKKQFGTMITEFGVTIKKDAESVITNDKIRNSTESAIKYIDKQKQMLDLPIGDIKFNYTGNFKDEFAYNHLGENYRIDTLSITDNSYKMRVSQKIDGKWKIQKFPINGTYKSLFDLWNLFGGAYSTDINGNFNEGSNELLYKIVTTANNFEDEIKSLNNQLEAVVAYSASTGEDFSKEDKEEIDSITEQLKNYSSAYPLKDKMIHILSNLSAVKAGGTNVNSSKLWTNNNPLAYFTFKNRFMGPQLDASHHTDESKIKEVTQVISALAQNSKTASIAQEAYQDIANVIQSASANYVKYMIPKFNPKTNRTEVNIEGLSTYLSEKFVDTILHTKGDNIAKVLVQTFTKDQTLPFSNQNFYGAYVKDIITRMNNEFITRYYSGTGAILIPSHGIVQMYDIPQADGTFRVVTQADLAKEALNNQNSTNYVTSKDRIIYGHPGIGKTYLFTKSKTIIDFDSVYKPQLKEFIAKSLNKNLKDLTKDEINEFKETSIYAEELSRVWELAKSDAAKSGKQLFASDLLLLSNHIKDFDRFLNMSSETFIKRSEQRGELNEYTPIWKQRIDDLLSTVDQTKIITTDKYLADLIVNNNFDIIKSHIKNKLVDDPNYTWDKIQVGDTVKIDGVAVTLSSPNLYYQYKNQHAASPKDLVTRVYNVPRDLKPSLHTFTVAGIQRNTFDLLPIQLRFELNKDKDFEKSEFNQNVLSQFANYIISLGGKEGDLNKYLSKWTQRELDLLDEGIVMEPLLDPKFTITNEDGTKTINFKAYFGEDDLVNTIYNDAKSHYLTNNSIKVDNMNFESAELVLGDIYKTKFNRDFNDSIYEIQEKGYQYFSQKLAESYEDDSTDADIKLNISSLDHPIYIKYVADLPGNDPNITLRLKQDFNSKGDITQKFVRYNDQGQVAYSLPNHQNMRVAMVNGKETIFIKGFVKSSEEYYEKLNSFDRDLEDLLRSFKSNIKSFIPLMNNSKTFTGFKGENDTNVQWSHDSVTLREFARFSGYTVQGFENLGNQWYKDNRLDIANQLGQKMFASWQKSHEFVAARIPSQSMQSFMPMKNVAYHNTLSNDAYVSVWQVWLQGSDFDIDKAYMLGYGFNSNGQFDSWSNISDYSTKAQLNELEKLPLPNGIKVQEGTGLDLTTDVLKYFVLASPNIANLKELSVDQIRILNDMLRKIGKSNPIIIQDESGRSVPTLSVIIPGTEEQKKSLITLLNRHNLSKEYVKREDAIKNSVVTRIKQIITSPSNQMLATAPVEVDTWHSAAKKALELKAERKGETSLELLSSYDMFSYYKQQKDAAVGKDDVGIAANGLKATFALSSYYNDYYDNVDMSDINKVRRDFKTFKKDFIFFDADGNRTEYTPAVIADVNISNLEVTQLNAAIGAFEKYRTNTALALSAFTSAATDNAKELLMAKINASVELASMHIYLMTLGFTPNQIAEIMTSDVIDDVLSKLETNIFFDTKTKKVGMIFEELAEGDEYKKDPNKMQNLKTLSDIYQGAQEMKIFSRLLSANQKRSANTEELTKFLTNFETSVYARENSVFGKHLIDFEIWSRNKDSVDPALLSKSQTKFEELIDTIFKNNNQLNPLQDREYVKGIINKANNIEISYTDESGSRQKKTVSLIGGKFDYRYYIDNENIEYKNIAKEYYNLIKNTINIFDVIDSVPHFKSMIGGIILSFNMLNNTSKKFNFVQNRLRETVRSNSSRIVFSAQEEANENVRNQMGNVAFSPTINSANISKSILGLDMRLRSLWLKEESTNHLVFNVNQLIADANAILSDSNQIKNFAVYMTDDARNIDINTIKDTTKDVRIINADDTDPTIVSLNTNYGIANFKRIMEEILLPVLKTKSSELSKSLRVQSSFNAFGLRGNTITSVFPLSSMTNPVAKDRAIKLIKAFNDLDISNETQGLILNRNGKELKWRDLFYTYNLLVNNEKYGDLRLTPLFQDYVKEKDSLGYDYVSFSSKIDSGAVDLFDALMDLKNDTNYISADEDEKRKMEIVARQELDNDVLFYAYNTTGRLYVKNEGKPKELLSVTNPDFSIVTSITATPESKKRWKELNDIMNLIKSRGFIIKFEC